MFAEILHISNRFQKLNKPSTSKKDFLNSRKKAISKKKNFYTDLTQLIRIRCSNQWKKNIYIDVSSMRSEQIHNKL
ncbi:hypothetical protein BpHYR1_027550 [Brachionus plicatilis]|uniref:Uncharacterized protein n=1 Tax=Brachionus plicatilis TaxID=10195 RepID=A0A3M7PFU1_BRAPC|nr:hypothetical protein BpHYR1_027550 [Brachionus plicatilis]